MSRLFIVLFVKSEQSLEVAVILTTEVHPQPGSARVVEDRMSLRVELHGDTGDRCIKVFVVGRRVIPGALSRESGGIQGRRIYWLRKLNVFNFIFVLNSPQKIPNP